MLLTLLLIVPNVALTVFIESSIFSPSVVIFVPMLLTLSLIVPNVASTVSIESSIFSKSFKNSAITESSPAPFFGLIKYCVIGSIISYILAIGSNCLIISLIICFV